MSDALFLTEAYDYVLPRHLIAQEPSPEREHSRLMVLARDRGEIVHSHFWGIQEFLRPGDLLVVNNSKVFPARLVGEKETGGRVDVLLLQPSRVRRNGEAAQGSVDSGTSDWTCFIRASRRPRQGQALLFPGGRRAEVTGESEEGVWTVRFPMSEADLFEYLDRFGLMPLPPYIKREFGSRQQIDSALDRERYQTVFARPIGSIAAPTAGFHFSGEICRQLSGHGIVFTEVTLHVGQWTFLPVRTGDIRNHRVRPEQFLLTESAASAILDAKREGRRVVAVGTTVVRCLESVFKEHGCVRDCGGWAEAYIIPGFRFHVVDALLTNFHLPRSSLLMLVSAFAGPAIIREAYREAVLRGYRFFSYGDCMLIQ